MFVNESAGSLLIFDVRYHGIPVTQIRTGSEMLKKKKKNLNIGKSMGPDGGGICGNVRYDTHLYCLAFQDSILDQCKMFLACFHL